MNQLQKDKKDRFEKNNLTLTQLFGLLNTALEDDTSKIPSGGDSKSNRKAALPRAQRATDDYESSDEEAERQAFMAERPHKRPTCTLCGKSHHKDKCFYNPKFEGTRPDWFQKEWIGRPKKGGKLQAKRVTLAPRVRPEVEFNAGNTGRKTELKEKPDAGKKISEKKGLKALTKPTKAINQQSIWTHRQTSI